MSKKFTHATDGAERALTAKQAAFAREYLIDLNATQAAIRAGYSAKTAQEQSSRLLSNAIVASAVQAGMDKRAEKVELTAEAVLDEIKKLAFSNMLDYTSVQADGLMYVDMTALTREQAAAIQEVNIDEYIEGTGEDGRPVKKVKVKLYDKRGSLELLGKHLKLFTDRIEVHDESGFAERLSNARARTQPQS